MGNDSKHKPPAAPDNISDRVFRERFPGHAAFLDLIGGRKANDGTETGRVKQG